MRNGGVLFEKAIARQIYLMAKCDPKQRELEQRLLWYHRRQWVDLLTKIAQSVCIIVAAPIVVPLVVFMMVTILFASQGIPLKLVDADSGILFFLDRMCIFLNVVPTWIDQTNRYFALMLLTWKWMVEFLLGDSKICSR